MKKYIIVLLTVFTIILNSCLSGQSQNTNTNLEPIEFAEKMKAQTTATLIDVRTPDEFSKGHIENAQNIDWRSNDFRKQIEPLDKSKPVFIYCLSGGRSSSAASEMREAGFKEVYELEGGLMKWRRASLPETISNTSTKVAGLSHQQFEALVTSDKLVLVDFYADWCAPCQKMKPYLEEISKDMADKVQILRINADDNQALCRELQIDALPVLQLYKNKNLRWNNVGFIDKASVLAQINK